MGRKVLKQQRAHAVYCRKQVAAGLMNMPDGTWQRPPSNSAMWQHMQAGYRLGEYSRRVRKPSRAGIDERKALE